MRKKWFHMVCWFLCNLSRAGESVALATKKVLNLSKELCSCSRGFLPTTLETQSPNVESSDRKNELLWQSKKCCKMQKKVVKNVAFLYQTTPARLNAADCPFNPTSTMPLNSMWPRCALPRKLLLTFDFDCFVPFAFKRFQFQVFKFENKCCY